MSKNSQVHTFVILAYKESPYLETCIRSILNQTHKSETIIATTTPNAHIENLAKKYNLEIIKGKHINIGSDFDFAISCGKTPLVTIAHQDDLYDKTYAEKVVSAYQKHQDSIIIFTDYYEIRGHKKIRLNTNLKIKRLLLTPFKLKNSLGSKCLKRSALMFGNAISCPTVTFVTKNCPQNVFKSHFRSNVDWHAWEKLSKRPGAFTFVPTPLMGHRISKDSTTTNIINQGLRTKEDYKIFQRFWPRPIAKLLTKLYRQSEKSNQLKP